MLRGAGDRENAMSNRIAACLGLLGGVAALAYAMNATIDWTLPPTPTVVDIRAGETVTWNGSFAFHPLIETDAGFTVFGATVNLVDEDKKKVRYQLVGQTEADAKVGRISYNSPLGRALIGRQKGEEVEVSTPSGDRYYEIKKIEFV